MSVSTNPTFCITYKLIGQIEEVSYETKAFKSEAALEDDLEERGSFGKVSYYLYSRKGEEPKRMSFI